MITPLAKIETVLRGNHLLTRAVDKLQQKKKFI